MSNKSKTKKVPEYDIDEMGKDLMVILTPPNNTNTSLYVPDAPSDVMHINSNAIVDQAKRAVENMPTMVTENAGNYIGITPVDGLVGKLLQQNGINPKEFARAQQIATAVGYGVTEGLSIKALECLKNIAGLERVYVTAKLGCDTYTGTLSHDSFAISQPAGKVNGEPNMTKVKIEVSNFSSANQAYRLECQLKDALKGIKKLGK